MDEPVVELKRRARLCRCTEERLEGWSCFSRASARHAGMHLGNELSNLKLRQANYVAPPSLA